MLIEPSEGVVGKVRVIGGIPATDVSIAEMLERLPEQDIHNAPARQLLVILQGCYEITTTAGDRVPLRAGDCLFTDDLTGKGHWSYDIGDERLVMVRIAVPEDWQYEGA
jgi:hypothetical protein